MFSFFTKKMKKKQSYQRPGCLYAFDFAKGVADLLGKYDATINGGVTQAIDGLVFDGNTGYLTLPAMAVPSQLTFVCILKNQTSQPHTQQLYCCGAGTSTPAQATVSITRNSGTRNLMVYFTTGASASYVYNALFTANSTENVMIAVVENLVTKNIKIYKNGQSVLDTTATNMALPAATTYTQYLGVNYDMTSYLCGKMAIAQLYNRALSDAEILDIYNKESWRLTDSYMRSGCVFAFDFYNDLYDLTNNGNNATINGGVMKSIDGLVFDGSTGYLSLPTMAVPNQLSFTCILKNHSQQSTIQMIAFCGNFLQTQAYFEIYHDAANRNLVIAYSTGSDYSSAIFPNYFAASGQENIVIAITEDFTNKVIKIYRNGKLFNTVSGLTMSMPVATAYGFYLGRQSSTYFLANKMSLAQFYNRILTDNEISDIYSKEAWRLKESYTRSGCIAALNFYNGLSDLTGNGYDATINSGVTQAWDGLDFDGTSGIATLPALTIQPHMSFICILKNHSTLGTIQDIISINGEGVGNKQSLTLYHVNNQKLAFVYTNGLAPQYYVSPGQIFNATSENLILGFTVDYAAQTFSFYKNGVLIITKTANNIILPSSDSFQVKLGSNYTYYLRNKMSIAQLYSRVLTDAEMVEIYNKESWRLTKESYQRDGCLCALDFAIGLNDMTGNGNNATLGGGVTQAIDGLVFDGSTGYVKLPAITVPNQLSFVSILKNHSQQTNRRAILNMAIDSVRTHAAIAISHFPSSTSLMVTYFNGITGIDEEITNFFNISVGMENIMLCVTCDYDNKSIAVYKNGVLLTTLTGRTMATPDTNTYVPYLGLWPMASYFLTGKMALAQIYNRILTANEVLEIYNKEKWRLI